MGVGTSTMQKLTGTLAGAALAATQIKGEITKGQEQGLLAKEQFHEASSALTELSGESEEAEKIYKEASDAYDTAMAKRPGGKGNTKASIEEKQKAALSEKEAAERAFRSLQDKMEAKKAMMARASLVMKRTGIGE